MLASVGTVIQDMLEKVRSAQGFIAALDQSGGSTPKALRAYGVADDQWSNDDEMFDLIHQMRTRIVTCPAFTGERILAAILFEQTMDRQIEGRGSAEYLWSAKRVVPFLKVDKGLADEADGVQLMKPIPGLDELVARAVGRRLHRHESRCPSARSVRRPHRPRRRASGRRPAPRSRPGGGFRAPAHRRPRSRR